MSLSDDHSNDMRKRYPNVPAHALPKKKFSDKTANDLTTMIIEHCRLRGIFAHRLSSEGRYRPGDQITDSIGQKRQMKGLWLPGLNVGLPDIFLIVRGQFIGIEVKVGRDKQSKDQIDMQRNIENAGGQYHIINTYKQFEQLKLKR